MTHLDPSALAKYNSLADPNLQSYFSNERIRSHLKQAGLISGQGDIISDGEYRTRLARREHRKHVRHMLAENIVNRAVDMERSRIAETKRKFEYMAKAALVNNIKESRRRSVNLSNSMSNSVDMGLLSIDSPWVQSRPKSANQPNETYNEYTRTPPIQSAPMKSSSKTPNRLRRRQKSLNKKRASSAQRPRSAGKYPDASPCQITMVYYGPHTKVDYDHLVFDQIDEIIVMQQHCGGENIIVHKENLKPGDEFTFNSQRHSEYPFGLSIYVKGFIDSRISTCCEYKHRHGVRLGGDRGHFAIKTVQGSKPCIKCRYEKQARLKKYAQSPKEKNDENKKPITIPLPVSDQPKNQQTPVQIPVRLTSIQNDNYSDDFDGSDKQKGSPTGSDTKRSRPNERKTKDSTPKVPQRILPVDRKESSRKSSSTVNETRTEGSDKKTWQIIFHTSHIPTGNFQIGNYSSKNILLKYSFMSNNQKNETETYEIDMKQFKENSKSAKQFSFQTKPKNIGKPEYIRLNIRITQDDDQEEEEEDDVKWHLDHIELIDPETQSHYIFRCKQWIYSSQQKVLRLSQETSQPERKRSTSSSSDDAKPSPFNHKTRQQSPQIERKRKTSNSSDDSTPTPSDRKTRQQSAPAERKRKPSNSSDDSQPSPSDQKTRQKPPPIERKRKTSSDSNDSKPSPPDRKTHQQSPKPEQTTKRSSSSNSSRPSSANLKTLPQSPKPEQKVKSSARSSTSSKSSKQSPTKFDSPHRASPDLQTIPKQKASPRSDTNDKENKIHYRIIIYPSHDDDGEFTPIQNSRIYIRLNNQSEEINLTRKGDQSCPTFKSGEKQTFEIDSTLKEQTNKLTIGYINGSNSAKQWKLEKITLENTETGLNTTFPCSETLIRDESNSRAEKTFKIESHDSSNQSTPRNEKIDSPKSDHKQQIKTTEKQQMNGDNKQRSPSFQSMTDADAHYSKIFKKLDPDDDLKLKLDSPPDTPKPRRSRQENTDQPVEPLRGLTDGTSRSNNQNPLPITTTDNGKGPFKEWYKTNDDDDD